MVSLTARLLSFGYLALVGVMVGIVLGAVDLIQNSLNGSLTIPSGITSALNQFAGLTGSAIIIAGVVALLGVVFYFFYIMRPSE